MEDVMVDAERTVTFSISDYYFKLTTEGIRLFSNSNSRYTSLGNIIDDRASRIDGVAVCHLVDDLRKHLRLIPADGDVSIEMTILETSASKIEEAMPKLERTIGSPVRLKDAVSLLLFDWIVERQATEIVMKLGLTAEQADVYETAYRRPRPLP